MTDTEFNKWEADCEKLRAENKQLLHDFALLLRDKNLKDKTIKKHVNNVDTYINHYLLYYDVINAASGIGNLNGYFSDFFIRKCMWSTPAMTKQTVASLKKFYIYLATIGKVSDADINDMKDTINSLMDLWLEEVRAYNDPDDDDWF